MAAYLIHMSLCAGFLDWVPKKMQRVGCMELLNTVQRRVQPKLHVFGHIHEGTTNYTAVEYFMFNAVMNATIKWTLIFKL